MKFKEFILTAIFPSRCVCCGRVLKIGGKLCVECENGLIRTTSKVCRGCGLDFTDCTCRKIGRQFEGICAPFEYTNSGRKLVFRYKFKRDKVSARFASEHMIRSIFTTFDNATFDAITYVPMKKNVERERGINQAYLLAKLISKETQIPISHALKQTGDKLTQHELPASLRVQNVAGVFGATKRICGQTVLLVDDICTTGATLNECTRVLKSAGAKSVYCCVTARTHYKNFDAE